MLVPTEKQSKRYFTGWIVTCAVVALAACPDAEAQLPFQRLAQQSAQTTRPAAPATRPSSAKPALEKQPAQSQPQVSAEAIPAGTEVSEKTPPNVKEAEVPAANYTVESLTAQRDQALASVEDESVKTRLTDAYQQAIDQLARIATLQSDLARFQQARETAESRAKELQATLDKPPQPLTVDETKTLTELEQALNDAEEAKGLTNKQLEEATQNIAKRTARRIEIRNRLIELGKQESSDESVAGNTGDPPAIVEARRTRELVRKQRIQVETAALQAELAVIDAEDVVNLPRLERDVLAREAERTSKAVEELQKVVARKRTQDAQEKVEATAGQAAEESNPVLRELAKRNEALAKQYQDLTSLIKEVQEEVTAAGDELKRIEEEAAQAEEKFKAIGLTDAIGKMLRKQKRSLPGRRRYIAEIRSRNDVISSAQLELLELEEESTESSERTLAKIGDRINQPIAGLREEARDAIARRNELLTPLIRAQSQYFDNLVELSSKQTQIVQEIKDFENFIDENVLWVRSSQPLFSNLSFDAEEFWLLSPSRWRDAWHRLFEDFSMNWPWYASMVILMIGLARNRFAFRARIRTFGDAAVKNTCVSFWPTFATIALTLIAALAWPVLVAFVAWRCTLAAGDNDILRALGHGLACVAAGYFPLDFLRLVAKPHGLAESHFEWSPRSMETLRGALRTVAVLGLPLVLMATTLSVGADRFGKETLERVPFIALTVILAVFLYRLLDDAGLFREYLVKNADGWIARLHPIWHPLAAVAPMTLAGLSLFGYHYTAQQLAWRLFLTASSFMAILVAYSILTRWLWIQRRRLSIEQSRKRREAQLAAAEEGADEVDPIEMPSADELRDQVEQSRSLLRTMMVGVALIAIWFAWIDVLPALSYLEEWPLWSSTTTVTEIVEDESGEKVPTTREVVDPITISDVLFAVFFFALAALAAQNIPGVLEISLLQRLPIDSGVRYAITTMVRYAIIAIGIFVSCNLIGIHWNQIQWMATALTFGLAFGLQEMFANFVAGIIILFERPIRVGDIVTVDDVTGKVSKVQIRATTITNWDCKDYIVPNKDFITGRVLNWTLSNKVNRIVVQVGLAYGSDREQAIEILKRIMDEHPLIEADPTPSVTFEGFGNSTLDFVVRCFISMQNMGSRLTVVHELHSLIDDAFRDAKIEIAFPQQDIHVRTMPVIENAEIPREDSYSPLD